MKASATCSLILMVQELGSLPIRLFGTDEQQRKWLPGLAAGQKLAAFALTEEQAGSDAGPHAATPWATQGVGRPLDVWVEDIPYRETRRYVKVVMGAWSAYRILAGGSPPALSAAVSAPRAGVSF